MGQTNVNASATNGTSTGTLTVNFSANNNDLIICAMGCVNSSGFPTGSNGPILDSSTGLSTYATSSNGSGAAVGMFYITSPSTGSHSISAIGNGTDLIDLIVLIIPSPPSCTTPDGTTPTATGSGTSVSPGTITGSYAGMFLTAVAFPSSNSISGGVTNFNSTYVSVANYYGQASSFNPTATLASGAQWASVSVHIDDIIESTFLLFPNPTSTPINTTKQIFYVLQDQCGNSMSDTVTWSMVSGSGSINSSTGVYSAPSSITTAVVQATTGILTRTATINVTNPAIATSFLLSML